MAKQGTKLSTTDAYGPFQPLMAFNGAILERLIRGGEACVEACLAWQQELFRFTSSRLQCDAKAGQALASCASLADAITVQKDWLGAAATDVLEEGQRLMELSAKITPAYVILFAPASAEPMAGRSAAE